MVLKDMEKKGIHKGKNSFNPCCSGNGAESPAGKKYGQIGIGVSILVVLEMVLKVTIRFFKLPSTYRFNPCCSGNGAERSSS